MTKNSKKYQERAEQLAKAIDIAELILKKSTSIEIRVKDHFINWGIEMKNMALNAEPPFNKIVSLKFIENDFLIYWNEADGEEVEEFWKEVYRNGLNLKRKDTIKTVLKRKKIKDIHEYNNIINNIVVAEQIGRINKNQALELSLMLEEFEEKKAEK